MLTEIGEPDSVLICIVSAHHSKYMFSLRPAVFVSFLTFAHC